MVCYLILSDSIYPSVQSARKEKNESFFVVLVNSCKPYYKPQVGG